MVPAEKTFTEVIVCIFRLNRILEHYKVRIVIIYSPYTGLEFKDILMNDTFFELEYPEMHLDYTGHKYRKLIFNIY